MKTRDRILQTSLELFNLCGEPNVTTIDIANEMDISPGNLYYHFRNKDEIIFELFQTFEHALYEALQAPQESSLDMMDYWMFLHIIFENIWEYRFLYRDPVTILERNERLQKKFNRILDKKRQTCIDIVQSIREQGMLSIRDKEITLLATNVVITGTYWLNFQNLKKLDSKSEPDDLGLGVYQVMSLLTPYLSDDAREMLEAVAETYLGIESSSS